MRVGIHLLQIVAPRVEIAQQTVGGGSVLQQFAVVRVQLRDEVHHIRHRRPGRQQPAPALANRAEIGHAVPHARVIRHLLKPLAEEHLVACVAHLATDERLRLEDLVHGRLRAVRRNQPFVQKLDAARIAERPQQTAEMLAAVVLDLHLRAEHRRLRDRAVGTDLTPGGKRRLRRPHAVHRHLGRDVDAVLAIPLNIPRLAQIEPAGNHAVVVVEILQTPILLHDNLDVPRRHRHALILDQREGLALLPVDREPQLKVWHALRRPTDHLQRGEQLKHAERHLHPLRHALQEPLRRLVLLTFNRQRLEASVLLHDGIRHLLRRDPHRLKPLPKRHRPFRFRLRRFTGRRRPFALFAHQPHDRAPVAFTHLCQNQVIHFTLLLFINLNLAKTMPVEEIGQKRRIFSLRLLHPPPAAAQNLISCSEFDRQLGGRRRSRSGQRLALLNDRSGG